jgi:hypothetical protein
VTYPDTSQESYSYQGGLGRLSQIQYPNSQSLGFSWNGQGQISQLQADDNGTVTSFSFSYNTRGKLASYSKSEGGITTEQWYLFHGPQGLEKAQRLQYGMLNLTLDFTTDPRGRILSMTHTPSGGAQGYTGEVYFHYDNAGNTSLLTNASGAPLASFQYELFSGMLINDWNPQNITFPWIGGGSAGGITLKPFPSKDLWISYDAYLKWQAMQEALKTAWEKIGKATIPSTVEGCCNEVMCWCNPCAPELAWCKCMSDCYNDKTGRDGNSWEDHWYAVNNYSNARSMAAAPATGLVLIIMGSVFIGGLIIAFMGLVTILAKIGKTLIEWTLGISDGKKIVGMSIITILGSVIHNKVQAEKVMKDLENKYSWISNVIAGGMGAHETMVTIAGCMKSCTQHWPENNGIPEMDEARRLCK